jgi:hypothetical protein
VELYLHSPNTSSWRGARSIGHLNDLRFFQLVEMSFSEWLRTPRLGLDFRQGNEFLSLPPASRPALGPHILTVDGLQAAISSEIERPKRKANLSRLFYV